MNRKEIWVYLERNPEEIEDVSLEILGRAKELGKKSDMSVVGVMLGKEPGNLGDIALKHGADKVIFLKDSLLESYSTEDYTKALFEIINKRMPEMFLLGATYQGRDLAGRLSARLRTGLTANVVSLDIDTDGYLLSGVPGYGSKVLAEIICVRNKPQMSTVRPGIFSKKLIPIKAGIVEVLEQDLQGSVSRVRVVSRKVEKHPDLSRAEKVIIAGNGVEGNLDMVTKLADIFGARLGVSRPIADKGKASRELQVGSTGYSLNAKLVLIFGVSGAEHFLPGIANCQTVISINMDRESDIFEYSDYCVVADASKIIPILLREGGDR